MKIIAIPIKGKELEPGDLFSSLGQEYWDKVNVNEERSVGEKVYIRTSQSLRGAFDENIGDQDTYKIIVTY